MKIFSKLRKSAGATMALMAVCILFFGLVAAGFFYMMQFISGDKQLCNATDAGALAAGQQILAVSLTKDQLSNIPNVPQEFLSLGVNPDGTIQPDPTKAAFNEEAYNNMAAYTTSIVLSTAADPTAAAVTNAQYVVAALNAVATQLNANMQSPSYSAYPGNAAASIIPANPANNLPANLIGAQTSLIKSSVQYGYYAGSKASNVFLSSSVAAALNPTWLSQIQTNIKSPDGSSYLLKGNTVIDFTAITGIAGLGKIALVALEPQPTHLIASSNFSTSLPNMSPSDSNNLLPCNSVQLEGLAGTQSGGNGNGNNGGNNQGPVGSSNSSSNSMTLTAMSAAVAGGGGPAQTFTLPGTSPVTTTTTAGVAYVALINGGDFQASMNSAGLSAAVLQSNGYANIDINPGTNIAFNGSKTDIFDVLDWCMFEEASGMTDWLIVGTDSITGLYDTYVNQGLGGWETQVATGQQNFPAHNYNDVVDNPNLAQPIASIPFVFLADYQTLVNNSLRQQTTMNADASACLSDFGAWIAYNRSAGTLSTGADKLNRNPALDPLRAFGGSPKLFASNPNYVVSNTLISATSDFMQQMPLVTALKLVDICAFNDGKFVFTGQQYPWVDNSVPVAAANYGFNYTPTPLTPGEFRPNGVPGILYAKLQVVLQQAGVALLENPPVLPSNPGVIFLPGNIFSNSAPFSNAGNVSSGILGWMPFDTQGNRSHYAIPEASGCPQFETPYTPLQYLKNIAVLNESSQNGSYGMTGNNTVSSNDSAYSNLLNAILAVVQKMNSAITLNDLTTVLDSPTSDTGLTGLDLGQTFYLIYNSSQTQNHGLQMISILPSGTTYQPGDGSQPTATLQAGFSISSSNTDELSQTNHTLVDTAAAPNSQVLLPNGQTITPAPYGDNETHAAPYNVNSICYPNGANMGGNVWAQDTATFTLSSGANNNNGELRFSEKVGGTFHNASIN